MLNARQRLAISVSVALAGLATLTLVLHGRGQGPLPVLVACIPIVVLRRWPLPVLAVAAAATGVEMAWGHASLPLGVMLGLATYFAAARLPRRLPIRVGVAVAASLDWKTRQSGSGRLSVERASNEVREERVHIAREVHDVVAHTLAVITVQAGVGLRLMAKRPEQASSALESIEMIGPDCQDELRVVLGLLRDEEVETASLVPAPRLADLKELVETVRASGTRWSCERREPTDRSRLFSSSRSIGSSKRRSPTWSSMRREHGRPSTSRFRPDQSVSRTWSRSTTCKLSGSGWQSARSRFPASRRRTPPPPPRRRAPAAAGPRCRPRPQGRGRSRTPDRSPTPRRSAD